MKTSFSKVLTILLVLAVVLVACSSNQPTKGNETAPPATNNGKNNVNENKDPVTIQVLHHRTTNFPDDNPVLQEINKRTGVKMVPITVDQGELQNKLNVMIASKTLPDIISFHSNQLEDLVNNGVIIPLDDLLNEYGKEILANKGEYLKKRATQKGNIYALPSGHGYPSMLAMRKDWLDAVDKQPPTTIEEYYEVLKAFVKNDPNQSGKADTMGLGAALESPNTLNHIFTAYGVTYGRPQMIDGQLLPHLLQPGYLDAVKFINKLYKEGLIDPDFTSIPLMQSFERLWNGQAGSYDFAPVGVANNWMSRYAEPKPEWVFPIVRGSEGKGGPLRVVRDNNMFYAITTASKHPEEAMKLLNFLNSEEGDQLAYLGIEGTHYEMKDGKVTFISPYEDAAQHRNEGAFAYYAISYRIGGMEDKMLNQVTQDAIKLGNDNSISDDMIYTQPAIEKELGTILTDMELEVLASLALSTGDLDKEYASFKQRYLDAGGQRWVEEATEIYLQEQKK